MDDIYNFSKNFSLRIDELEEVRWNQWEKNLSFPLSMGYRVLVSSCKEMQRCPVMKRVNTLHPISSTDADQQ